jgi:pimeloyl-ACP methyl ester carboxylesterase
MNMKSIVFAMALLVASPSLAVQKDVFNIGDPLHHMEILTPADAIARRATLSNQIFGPGGWPTTATNVSGAGSLAASYFSGKTIASSTWYGWMMDSYSDGQIWARTLLTTFSGSTCLAVINGGHGQGYFGISPRIPTVDMMAQYFAGGCDVILSSMPYDGENVFARSYIPYSGSHEWFATRNVPSGSAIKYFLAPTMGSIDVAINKRAAAGLSAYNKIITLGISGGGWATTLMAALDPRITHSFAVAGSVPLAYRVPTVEGDWEQYNLPIDYLDLYAMSVAETGRKSYLLYNGHDSCCFRYAAVAPWARALIDRLDAFPGDFGIYTQLGDTTHEIGLGFRYLIIDLAN